jgi:hypothetical protein
VKTDPFDVEPKDREPSWVHCRACQHEWPGVWLPMEALLACRVMKAHGKLCPRCGAKKVSVGRVKP